MNGPPLGPGGAHITWPEQVAAGAERHLVPETSNLKLQTLFVWASMQPCNKEVKLQMYQIRRIT